MTSYVPTQDLYDLLDQEEIFIEYLPLKRLDGFYYQEPGFKLICIRQASTEKETRYRSILAEEIAHHFTNPSNKEPSKYLKDRGRIDLDKSESAAIRWAADFLIPDNLLLEYLSTHQAISIYELCALFRVEKYLMVRKFITMSRKHKSYPLHNGTHLILSHLPSIYITDSLDRCQS
jgi:Zn-dependent peptidase ImmA (M78 family)